MNIERGTFEERGSTPQVERGDLMTFEEYASFEERRGIPEANPITINMRLEKATYR